MKNFLIFISALFSVMLFFIIIEPSVNGLIAICVIGAFSAILFLHLTENKKEVYDNN
jgi:hypothetical protein